MCYPIGARLAQRRILALDTLYHHLFTTPGRNATTINQLKHDLVLWLTHHIFEELPDALEYYLADPNSDLEGDLAHLTFLDPWGVQVHIHPLVTIYMNTLLAWAKCFLSTYGVYPGLYDLLDTPRLDFLAAQLHLRDSTFPRPLLHQSRGPPTIRSEYVALQPHLDPPPPPDHLYVCRTHRRATSPSVIPTAPTVCLSPRKSVALSVHPTDTPSVIPTAPTVCLSPRKSVALSVHPTDSPSVIPARPSPEPSVHPPVTPSLTRPSAPPHPSVLRNVSQTVHHRLTVCTPSYHVCQTVLRHLVCTTHQPVRQTIRHRPHVCTTPHPSVRPFATVTPSV